MDTGIVERADACEERDLRTNTKVHALQMHAHNRQQEDRRLDVAELQGTAGGRRQTPGPLYDFSAQLHQQASLQSSLRQSPNFSCPVPSLLPPWGRLSILGRKI